MKTLIRALCFVAMLGAMACAGNCSAQTLTLTLGTPLPTVTLNGPNSWGPVGSQPPLVLPPVQVPTFPHHLRADYVVDGVSIGFTMNCTGTLTYTTNINFRTKSPLTCGAEVYFQYTDPVRGTFTFPVRARAETTTGTTMIFYSAVISQSVAAASGGVFAIPFPNLPFFSTGTNTTFSLTEYIGPAYFANYLQMAGVANPLTIRGVVGITYYYHHK
jgi:hypothetical protein